MVFLFFGDSIIPNVIFYGIFLVHFHFTINHKDWNEDIKEKKYLQEKKEIEETLNIIKEKANTILKTPELMKEFMTFSKNFNNYSAFNRLYIQSQNPSAFYVATKSFFNKENISVRKEELKNSLKIFKPEIEKYFYSEEKEKYKPLSMASNKEKELIEKGIIEVKEHMIFIKVPVYDITQTNAQKQDYPKLLHREERQIKSNIDVDRTLITMVNELRRKGINVDFKYLSDPDIMLGTKGYTDTKNQIVLNLKDTSLNQLKVLTHEYAHCVLHNQDRVDKNMQKKLKEFEAETTSFIVLEKFGISSQKDSPMYIMNWGKDIVEKLENNVNDKEFSSVDILKDIQEGVDKVSELLEKSITIKKDLEQKNTPEVKKVKPYIAPKNQNSLESNINYNLQKEMEKNQFWKQIFQDKEKLAHSIEEQETSIQEAERYIKDYSFKTNPTQEEKNQFKIATKKRNCCIEKKEILKGKWNDLNRDNKQDRDEIIEERTEIKEDFMLKL